MRDWFFFSTKVIRSILHRAIRSSRGVRNCQISPTGSNSGIVLLQFFPGVRVLAASSAFDLEVQLSINIVIVEKCICQITVLNLKC